MTGSFSAASLLEIWDRGANAAPWERALLLLAAAYPEESPEALARLSIGARDARLLDLRRKTFGADIGALCTCPKCGEPVEMTFDTCDILVSPQEPTAPSLRLREQDYDVKFRLPDSFDLAALDGVFDKSLAARQLFERCLLDVRLKDQEIAPNLLPAEISGKVAEHIALLDAQSEIELDIVCPACRHAWTSLFDIATFFWNEISVVAKRLLQEVHTLACAYGWSEEAILSLSAARRQAYLEMVLR